MPARPPARLCLSRRTPHLPAIRFLAFDALGAAIWTAAYTAVGYIFRNQLDLVATHIVRMGAVVAIAIAAALTYYAVRRFAPRRLGVSLDLGGIAQRRSSF
ncbi:MAG: DedA family protein [Bryobacteraceae bacterium]